MAVGMPAGAGRCCAGTAIAVLLVSPLSAQTLSADIHARIGSAFDQLLGNDPELAIPLTRRALARRSQETGQNSADVAALSYAETGSDEPRYTAAIGSIDDNLARGEDDPDIARRPRPRPEGEAAGRGSDPQVVAAAPAQDTGAEPMGGPLDLVAGAADPLPPQAEVPAGIVVSRDDVAPVAESDPVPVAAAAPVPEAPAAAAAMQTGAVVAGQEEVVAASDAPLDVASINEGDAAAQSRPEVAGAQAVVETAGSDAAALVARGPVMPASAPIAPFAPAVVASVTPQAVAPLVAGADCLTPDALTDEDGDFKRNEAALAEPGFCIAETRFKERRRDWVIETVRSGRAGPLFAVMHDDEDMSFDNAVAALKLYGGTLVAVDTGGQRNQDGIDPNRNFSGDGIGCAKLGDDESPRFTAAIHALIELTQPLIALHNNTGEHIPTGGHGHVAMTDVPKDMEAFAAADPDGPLAGDRALVLLASAEPARPEDEARARALSAKGVNAVIENVQAKKGDCSLSNFAYLAGQRGYFNVTVDEDEGAKQLRIIAAILADDQQLAAQTR